MTGHGDSMREEIWGDFLQSVLLSRAEMKVLFSRAEQEKYSPEQFMLIVANEEYCKAQKEQRWQ